MSSINYSYLNGSTGFNLDALVAGYKVTKMQIKKDANVAHETSYQSIRTGILFPPGYTPGGISIISKVIIIQQKINPKITPKNVPKEPITKP